MEISGRKSELMKPIILKAGIPLAVSFAGFIFSLIIARRKLHIEEDQPSRNETEAQEEFGDDESVTCTSLEDDQRIDSLMSLRIQYRPTLEEMISGLMKQVRALQDREQNLEMRFLCYCGLKEYELAFTKIQHKLVLEQAHAEFLDLRIESMEAEKRRFESMVVEYLRVLRQLGSENRLLRKKASKLWRTARKNSKMMQAREDEIATNHEQLQGKAQVIVKLQDEIMALKRLVDRLQEEKKEFADRLELGETSASSSSSISMKQSEENTADSSHHHHHHHHDQLLTELEGLRKDRTAEAEELIYLRWINACFRHELMRNQELLGHDEHEERKHARLEEILRYDSDASSSTTITEHDESCALAMATPRKKATILHKLRRWVKGSEACRRRSWNGKDDQHTNKFDRIHSVTDRVTQRHQKARKSCSSV